MDKERTCGECKITKPLTDFYKRRDDFTKRCKECICKAERLRYKIKGIENVMKLDWMRCTKSYHCLNYGN